jgi:predicted ATPase/DNA-binding XRE family transcriptional regulator
MPAVSFGQWVKKRRKELDLTQEELALRISCSMTLIQKIEAGERRPSRQMAELLSQQLAVPIDERPEFIRFAREKIPSVGVSESMTLRTLRHRFTNLPVQPTPLFGRDSAIEKIKQQLLRKQARLLTLVGPPGVGKTRLGIEVGSRLVNDYEDGVFLVSLAAVTNPEMVISTLGHAFCIPESSGQAPLERVKAFLEDKRLLLLLDNLEQVITAGPILADLLAACPWIQILVTSRVSLHIRAERQYRVQPLELAPLTPVSDLTSLLQYPAIAMFLDRAQAIDPDFELTSGNAAVVAEICALLDGLPLAIELVVSHTSRMPLPILLSELKSRLPLLTSGPRDLPVRQHSLRQAIRWSYDLLDPDEQHIFSRLAVFVGGCTLEAAQFVGGDDSSELLPGAINNLIDKNLVIQPNPKDDEAPLPLSETRLTMLETIREYGLEVLEHSGEAEAVRLRHAAYYLELLERADPVQNVWLHCLESEHDNLRAALSWTLDRRDAGKALRITGGAWRFWQLHGHLREGLSWLDAALTLELSLPDLRSVQARAKALLGAGWLLRDYGDWMRMKASFEDSLSLYREIDDPEGLAYALYSAGYANFLVGDGFYGIGLIQKSLDFYRSVGDKRGVALALMMLGRIAVGQGNYRKATSNFAECLQLVQDLESTYGIALATGNLGELALYCGDYGNAASHLKKSQDMLNQLGETQLCAWVLTKRAELAWRQGLLSKARSLLEESLEIAKEFGYRWNEAYSLAYLGMVILQEGDPESAQSLCEASLTIFQELQSEGDIAQAKKELALIKLQRGDFAQSTRLYKECLDIFKRRSYRPDIVECLVGLAAGQGEQGDFSTAAHLLGVAYGLRETIGSPLSPILRQFFERTYKLLHEHLDDDTFAPLWKLGKDEGCSSGW